MSRAVEMISVGASEGETRRSEEEVCSSSCINLRLSNLIFPSSRPQARVMTNSQGTLFGVAFTMISHHVVVSVGVVFLPPSHSEEAESGQYG